MKRRIKSYLLGVTTLALLVFFLANLLWIRDRFEAAAWQSLDSWLSTALYLSPRPPPEDELEEFAARLAASYRGEARVTVVDARGRVLADSGAAPEQMEDHQGREELAEAARAGYGRATRTSGTTGVTTLYAAGRWGEEGHLLRLALPVAVTASFIIGLLPGMIALVLAVAVLSSLFAGKVTKRITAPYDKMFAAIEAALQRRDKAVEFEAAYEEMEPVAAYFRTVLGQISGYIAQITAKTEQIEHITGAMEEGLIMLDERTEIILINPQGAAMLGVPQSTWQKNIHYLYRDERFAAALDETRRTGRRQVTDIPGSHGTTLRFYINPVPDGGYVLLISDVTELIQLERMRSDFAANVSHELKTPLTSVSGFAELIQTGLVTDPEQVREYAGKILTESRRLVMLIDDVLRLSSIESGKREEEEPVALGDVVAYTVEMLDGQIRDRELTVEVSGELLVRTSRQRMMELAFNLLDNAVKYNRTGGRVTVRMEGLSLWVENTGAPIPPEHQGRIFERFYRADAARSRRTGGTGLGLSIAKHIAEQNGGSIAVESHATADSGEEGVTRFTVSFGQERVVR